MQKLLKIEKWSLLGAASVMLAAFMWSLDGVFIRPKLYSLEPEAIIFVEHFLGFIILSPFMFLGWKKIKILRKRDWGAILWVCIFGGLIGSIMITKAFFAAIFGQTTFATVIILQKLQPVFALGLARIVLKEKLSKKFYIWSAIAVLSAYFLAFGKSGLNISEIDLFSSAAFFAFVAAFGFGSSTVFGKRIVNHLDFRSTAALRFGITSILALILVLALGKFSAIGEINFQQWRLILLVAFTTGAPALFIYYFGLKKISASAATVSELFWPFSAIILDYLINGNTLSPVQIIFSLILIVSFYEVIKEGRIKTIEFEALLINGQGRGERLGFPTINLDKIDLDISYGVYKVEINSGKHRGLMHFGPKETYDESPSTELYVNYNIEDIGKEKIKVKVLNKIREIKKFENSELLKKQIKEDLKSI